MIDYETFHQSPLVRPQLVRPQTALTIPPAYLPLLQSLKLTTGCQISWLAAVCQQTGWDPNFLTLNGVWNGQIWSTARQFGVAGIWGDLPELCIYPTAASVCGGCTDAGWVPAGQAGWTAGCGAGPFCWSLSSYCGYGCNDYPNYMQYAANLNAAARILVSCANTVRAACGSLNSLVFLAYILGCQYIPQVNPGEACTVPPGLPTWTDDYVKAAVAAQAIFAEQVGETPIVPPAIKVTLTATPLLVQPNTPVTFSAQVTGGVAPYSYLWNFGDGKSATTSTPSTQHSYTAVGSYAATATVSDTKGNVGASVPVSINVSATAPPPGGSSDWLLWALVGVVGVGALVAIAHRQTPEGKRQQAARLRQEASRLRQEASKLRAQGRPAEAQQKELQAAQLEARATELERQAQAEETARLYQEGQPVGSQKIAGP